MEKLGFNSVASLVNSISDVVKKVIQNGMYVNLYMCYKASVHPTYLQCMITKYLLLNITQCIVGTNVRALQNFTLYKTTFH